MEKRRSLARPKDERRKEEGRSSPRGSYSTVAKFERELSPRDRAILESWCKALDDAQSSDDDELAFKMSYAIMEHLERTGVLKRIVAN